ncbi:MAG: 2-hydroxyacid dehydrogenase [Candidatus Promineifilaceae bacterium]
MPLSVYFPNAPEPESLELLKEHLRPGIKVTIGEIPSDPDYHVLVTGRPSLEQLQASPNLQAVIVPWAGVSPETRAKLADFPDVTLHNLHYNDTTTAELGFALLLSAAKFVPFMDRALRDDNWMPRYDPSPTVLLHHKTALILGYGAIGREMARMCKGLAMTVLATRRHPDKGSDEYADEIHPSDALPELLPRANALLVCLPHTPETEGVIGEKELALLPEKAVLVNIGRGKVVDEGALYEALKNGRLHAAGIDVWYNYPEDEPTWSNTSPANYPFHELDNIVMSPHRGGATMESEGLRMADLARLLNTAERGEPIPNKVSLELGY